MAVNEAPCGMSRQYLVELGNPKDLQIIFCSADQNGHLISNNLENILPNNFGPINLHQTESVLQHTQWPLKPDTSAPKDNATVIATNMLIQSYAPYTKSPIGVALVFKNNDIVPGQTIENAAYNPSLSALRGAFSLSGIVCKNLTDLTEIVMVGTKINNNRLAIAQSLVNTLMHPNPPPKITYSTRELATLSNNIEFTAMLKPVVKLPL